MAENPQCTAPTEPAAPPHTLHPQRSGGAGAEPLPSSSPYLLDPLQTTSREGDSVADSHYPRYDVNPDWIPFEHRGWHNVRMRILSAMEATEVPPARANKFLGCGEETYVYQESTTGEIDFHGSRCGDRFCLICGQLRSRRIARSLEPRLNEAQPLFITLTIRGLPGDRLANLIDRLNTAWKELRRLKHWRDTIDGGAIMLEIKWSRTSGGHWHPHYHLLCHGRYLDKQWLADAWKVVTRGSDQVDIQRVTDLPKALGYVVKYASKPMDASFTMRPHLLREAMTALKGRRLCACFGSWYGTPLNDSLEDPSDETQILTTWRYLGTCRDLEFRAQRGDREATNVLFQVERARKLRHALTLRCRGPDPMHAPAIGADLSAA